MVGTLPLREIQTGCGGGSACDTVGRSGGGRQAAEVLARSAGRVTKSVTNPPDAGGRTLHRCVREGGWPTTASRLHPRRRRNRRRVFGSLAAGGSLAVLLDTGSALPCFPMIARATIQAGAGVAGQGTPETVSQLCPGDRRNPAEDAPRSGEGVPKNRVTGRFSSETPSCWTFGDEA